MKKAKLIRGISKLSALILCVFTLCGCMEVYEEAEPVYDTPESVIEAFFGTDSSDTAYSVMTSLYAGHGIKTYGDSERISVKYGVKSAKKFSSAHKSIYINECLTLLTGVAEDIRPDKANELDFLLGKEIVTEKKKIRVFTYRYLKDMLGDSTVIRADAAGNPPGDEFGAEDGTQMICLFECAENTYMCGFTLLKYEGSWNILSLEADVGELEDGTLYRLTEEEYDEIAKRYG